MITFKHTGDFSKTTKFLKKSAGKANIENVLNEYGKAGVAALKSATPIESGLTADSWYYEIEIKKGSYAIHFCNSNINEGVPIAIILQYGHGTRNGGWVQGRDYINPAAQPVFDDIVNKVWREVTRL